MSEKRFEVIDDNFSKWIVDTVLTEDKHEGNIYTAYDMCRKLNELYEENEQLKEYCTMLKNQIKKMGEIGGFNKHMIKTILESDYDD